MKTLIMLIGALCACAGATARPLVLESTEVVPAYSRDFGFAGDEVISTDSAGIPNTDPERFRTTADLYRRGADGKWVFVQNLATDTGVEWPAFAAMTPSVAAVSMPNGLRVFERSSSGWTESAVDPASRIQGGKVDVVGNTILVNGATSCSSQASVLTRGTTGVWAISAHLVAPGGGCIDGLDLDEGQAIAHISYGEDVPSNAVIYQRSGSSWNAVATLEPQDSGLKYGPVVALRGALAIVADRYRGPNVYRRDSAGGWQPAGLLPNPDSYDNGQETSSIAISDQFIVQESWSNNWRAAVLNVFRRQADQTFQHVAILAGAPGDAHIDGTRVVASYYTDVHVFQLPNSFDVPPLVQDDFESGNAQQWTVMPGSQFAVVNDEQTHFYRQSSVAGDAGAIYPGDMTNQHVSADIRPLAFNGSGRWVGLMTRYTDPSNYYYVTLRNTDVLSLRRVVNGVITQLASYRMTASLQWHRIELESSGTYQTVYVDGNLVMYAFDSALSHGHAGIRTYRASADFDNVVVSPGPVAGLESTDRVATGGSWTPTWGWGSPNFSQTQADSGDARATSGLPREDMSVQATVTFDGVSATGTPWAGLLARYVDDRNYYYVTVRANEISLRKLTNGAITVLDHESFTRSPGTPIDLRLEAIGDRLRVYVDDVLRLEHAGAEVVAGKAGVMTYRAAATFSNYVAREP